MRKIVENRNELKEVLKKQAEKKRDPKKREPQTRGPQARGLQTREILLAVTSELMTSEGIQGLRYAQIAKKANIPQALMGYHFPTLEDLLLEVILRELEKLRSLSVEMVEKYASQPKKALAAYIRSPFDLASTDHTFSAIFSAFYHLAVVHPKFSEVNANIRKTGRERILNLVTMVLATEGQLNNGNTLTRDHLVELSTAVQGVMTGLCYMAVSEKNADYKEFSDLAVNTSYSILGI